MATFDELQTRISETKDWLGKELVGVRTGRATPALLDAVKVEAYGVLTPLTQLASVGVEDARTLAVTPWDREHLKGIEKGITEADLGVSVQGGDTTIRVSFPELTQERRDLLGKLVGDKLEEAKKTIRSHRNDAIDALEKQEGVSEDEVFRGKEEIQKIIDAGVKGLEDLAENKRKEIAA